MPTELTARAYVTTDAAPRYAKQLASHLGRRSDVQQETDNTRLVLAGGECTLIPTDTTLELHASAPTPEALERVKEVVTRHLERFSRRDNLVIDWD
jgi:uncharacterized protein